MYSLTHAGIRNIFIQFQVTMAALVSKHREAAIAMDYFRAQSPVVVKA